MGDAGLTPRAEEEAAAPTAIPPGIVLPDGGGGGGVGGGGVGDGDDTLPPPVVLSLPPPLRSPGNQRPRTSEECSVCFAAPSVVRMVGRACTHGFCDECAKFSLEAILNADQVGGRLVASS